MRELKFRVWNGILKKEFKAYDRFRVEIDGAYLKIEPYRYDNDCAIEQYTGLKDKNGKEIYEGDIVSDEFEYGGEKAKTIWQVRWCDDECAFELHYVSGFEVDDCWLVSDDEENYKVIGNIHENPELLEEECIAPQAE